MKTQVNVILLAAVPLTDDQASLLTLTLQSGLLGGDLEVVNVVTCSIQEVDLPDAMDLLDDSPTDKNLMYAIDNENVFQMVPVEEQEARELVHLNRMIKLVEAEESID